MIPTCLAEAAAETLLAHAKSLTLFEDRSGVQTPLPRPSLKAVLFSARAETARGVAERVAAGLQRQVCDVDAAPLASRIIGTGFNRFETMMKLARHMNFLIFISMNAPDDAPAAWDQSLGFILQEIERTEGLVFIWSRTLLDEAFMRRMHYAFSVE